MTIDESDMPSRPQVRRIVIGIAGLLIVVAAGIDLLTPANMIIPVLYGVPLALMAWSGSRELLWAFAKPGKARPRLIHRLDRDTSGVILTARTKPAAGFLEGERDVEFRRTRVHFHR